MSSAKVLALYPDGRAVLARLFDDGPVARVRCPSTRFPDSTFCQGPRDIEQIVVDESCPGWLARLAMATGFQVEGTPGPDEDPSDPDIEFSDLTFSPEGVEGGAS
jgi:hypothetical protein